MAFKFTVAWLEFNCALAVGATANSRAAAASPAQVCFMNCMVPPDLYEFVVLRSRLGPPMATGRVLYCLSLLYGLSLNGHHASVGA